MSDEQTQQESPEVILIQFEFHTNTGEILHNTNFPDMGIFTLTGIVEQGLFNLQAHYAARMAQARAMAEQQQPKANIIVPNNPRIVR